MMNKTNPWHDVEIGKKQPDVVQAVIEIPKGNKAKYELDKKTGLLRLDRVLYSAFRYPANYGFIPQTLGEDNDPLDIIVLCQLPIQPLCIIEAKVVGVMNMVDSGEPDDKIVAVANNDKSVNYLNAIDELPSHFCKELQNFFEEYKKLENKTVTVDGFQNTKSAKELIRKSIADYQLKYKL